MAKAFETIAKRGNDQRDHNLISFDLNTCSRSDILYIFEKLHGIKLSGKFQFGNCKICDDIASGVHYGVITCEGCKVYFYKIIKFNYKLYEFLNLKVFFKRSMIKTKKYNCYNKEKCLITPLKRKNCKACRFKKCLINGMSLEGIIKKKIYIILFKKFF
jgi:hypothetical protein